MTDLQGLSSNIVLIGFILVGIACLYLLYSNYIKTQELEELHIQVRVLKDVFTTSQKNYLELRDNVLSSLQQNNLLESKSNNVIVKNDVHDVFENIDKKDTNESIKTVIVEKQQDLVATILNSNNNENLQIEKDNKQIEIIDDHLKELQELDDLDDLDDSDDSQELETDDLIDENVLDLGNVDDIKENNNLHIEDIIDDMIVDNQLDDELDAKSIKTDPNNNDLNELEIDIDLDELQDHVDDTTNTDLDDEHNDTTKQIKVDDDLDLLSSILKNKEDTSIDENSKNITLDLELDLNDTSNIEIKKDDNTKSISLDQLLNNKSDDKVDLHSMSVKQLKELAKQKKIKTAGTKQELIQALQSV